MSANKDLPARSLILAPVDVLPSQMGELEEFVPLPDPKVKSILADARPDGRRYIPVCEAVLGGNETRYVTQAVRTGWISSIGPDVRLFEEAFASYCQATVPPVTSKNLSGRIGGACGAALRGVACSNGTTALQLALVGIGCTTGDEVILPSFTMVATIATIVHTGATPVLVDVDDELWQPNVDEIRRKITPRTRAIVVVHLYGHPADMDAIMELANSHGLLVIEDAAEAHGALYKGRRCGSIGDVGTFSFYANKLITTGEGGMVVTSNAELARTMRTLRDHGFSTERHFWHKYVAFNFRMTNLQACLGLAQVQQLDDLLAARQGNAALYRRLVVAAGVPGVAFQGTCDWGVSAEWMVGMVVDEAKFGMNRDQLRAALAELGVETRNFFIPMHMQPVYYDSFRGERYPVSERLCRDGFYLPSASSLSPQDIAMVVSAICKACPRLQLSPTSAASTFMTQLCSVPHANAFSESWSYYDIIYADKDTTGEALFVSDLLQAHAIDSGTSARLLDLGCGSGRHARALNSLGYHVTGVDREPKFVERAKFLAEKAQETLVAAANSSSAALADVSLDFSVGDAQEVRLESAGEFDAVVSLFDVINYQTTTDGVCKFLKTAHAHLKKNGKGLLLFSMWYGPAVLAQVPNSFRQRRVGSLNDSVYLVRHCYSHMRPNENIVDVRYRTWMIENYSRMVEESTTTTTMSSSGNSSSNSNNNNNYNSNNNKKRRKNLTSYMDTELTTRAAALESLQVRVMSELHELRYFFMPEMKSFLNEAGFEMLQACEWMSGRPVSDSTWSVTIIARAK